MLIIQQSRIIHNYHKKIGANYKVYERTQKLIILSELDANDIFNNDEKSRYFDCTKLDSSLCSSNDTQYMSQTTTS